MKHLYTVRLTSDDWTSECQFDLTEEQRDWLLLIAEGFNAKARFRIDHRVSVESADPIAPTGEVA